MLIKFISLILFNFKAHKDLEVKFADLTKIFADNAKGKSSILEAITFLLYGTDALGSKMDPSPVTYEADETKVSLLLNVDGKELLLGRAIKKGKVQYFINEVPSKAGEFNEVLEQLFDKDLFLSLFNPNYFFTLHWEKQRGMLMKYVSSPARKEVLKHMPDGQASELEKLLKKHSLDDLEKIHRANKTKLDKDHIAAQSRFKTLKEQLEENAPTVALETLQAEENKLLNQIKEIEKVTDSAGDNNRKINTMQTRINSLLAEREQMKVDFQKLKSEEIADTCRVCHQPLKDKSLKAAEEEKQNRIENFKRQYDELVINRKTLEADLAQLEHIDVSEQIEKVRELENQRAPILQEIRKHQDIERLQEQVGQAEQQEKEILQSLNESIFILDSIKDFRAKEAELQAEKVQSLFENLSIKLFETLKNGEIKPTFEIQMDGKDYRKLSLSEGIRAGLELRDVLSQQSEIITPCFVDNAESITKFKQPNGQLIISKVVAGQGLTIEGEDN